MKVDDILQEHSVDIEMTILDASPFLVHHADEVAKPVESPRPSALEVKSKRSM